MATNRSYKQPLLSVLGLIVFIALLWFVLTVIKGVLSIILSILLFVLVALLVWRLVKAGFYRAKN